jgi:hypothetical protein
VVPSAAGAVVLRPFPFSDLSRSKLRPVALADAGRGGAIGFCARLRAGPMRTFALSHSTTRISRRVPYE